MNDGTPYVGRFLVLHPGSDGAPLRPLLRRHRPVDGLDDALGACPGRTYIGLALALRHLDRANAQDLWTVRDRFVLAEAPLVCMVDGPVASDLQFELAARRAFLLPRAAWRERSELAHDMLVRFVSEALDYEHEWSDLGEGTNTVHQWLEAGSQRELGFGYAQRDGAGRLTRGVETLNDGVSPGAVTVELRYAYDTQGRLMEVRRDGAVTEAYAYEGNGQRTSATVNGAAVAPIVFDARDRLTQYGGVTYQYDALGRRTSRTQGGQTTTYTYDLLGALRAVDLPGSSPDIEYVIDGAGRRVGRKVGGVLTHAWLYLDGLRPIVEMNGAGQVTRVFVYGEDRLPDLMIIPAGQLHAGTYRILTDHLGSVRRVVNVQTGAVLQAIDYDAFGNVLSDTRSGIQPFGFAGGLYDPDTGLLRFGARDYDPRIGQWTARDPMLFGPGDSNLYAYVGGDPVNWLDPHGRSRSRYWLVVRLGMRLVRVRPVSANNAVKLIRKGRDILCETRQQAKNLARAASDSGAIDVDGVHPRDGIGVGYPHVHPLDHRGRRVAQWGHVFWDAPQQLNGWFGSVAEVLDVDEDGVFDGFDVLRLANPLDGAMPTINLNTGEVFGGAGDYYPAVI